MSEELETIKYAGMTIKVYQDESPSDPRENDNMGVMVCGHRRYTLGDEQVRDVDELNEKLAEAKAQDSVILPLYLIDHSGIAMRTRSYSDIDPGEWDSGSVGFIYATAKAIRENYMVKRITKATREKAIELLTAEVQEYSDYIEGNVYGYVIEDVNGEHMGSCWGFVGDTEYAITEAKAEADAIAAQVREEEAAEFARLPIP